MSILHALILGAVEGLTEFLPISSTFHLIFSAKFLGVAQTDFSKLFEVFIQAGAILAVVFLYFREIMINKELFKKTLTAFLPTAIIGFILYKTIKTVFFESSLLMIFVFFLIGLLFLVYEFFLKKQKTDLKKTLKIFSYKDALLIGFIQSLAVVPGVSRAGAVILGMMILGYKRSEAAKFSFLLAAPTIFAAGFFDLFKMREIVFNNLNNINLLLIGFITAFIFAHFSIKWFIGYLQTNSLTVFGIYRIIIALLLYII